MIIFLHSKLFTKDPALRFAEEYNVSPEVWRQMWKYRQLNGWSNTDLAEYFEMKVGHKPDKNAIARWIARTRIYMYARPFIQDGHNTVTSSVFGIYEKHLIAEITKNMRYSGKKKTRAVL
jgi:hypothetical protein